MDTDRAEQKATRRIRAQRSQVGRQARHEVDEAIVRAARLEERERHAWERSIDAGEELRMGERAELEDRR